LTNLDVCNDHSGPDAGWRQQRRHAGGDARPCTATAGRGGERTNTADHKLECGLLGVTVAPDFLQTGPIYVPYFPSFNPNTRPPGLGIDRRISKMERPRISRFTMDLGTKTIDLSSEVRIFEYDAQIFSCCHVGGGMGFDSAGDLYITTGDTNSSQGTGGYSGNNPDAKCPTGDPTEPSSQHCGSNAISYPDAHRTAGNTNDYNGKMCGSTDRLDPGRHAAAGRDRHDVHDPRRDRPERPEPARGTTPDGTGRFAFSIGRSGGVSYRWDFGDGSTATATNPTHRYAAAGTYDVTLTVTYADGTKASKTIQVTVA
jgi:chitodextrinase